MDVHERANERADWIKQMGVKREGGGGERKWVIEFWPCDMNIGTREEGTGCCRHMRVNVFLLH
jgi:hypothetical protein